MSESSNNSLFVIIPSYDTTEPDLTKYRQLRTTRRFKYYILINNNTNTEFIENADESALDDLANDFLKKCRTSGGKRKTKRVRKHRTKSRKSRKSRK